MIDATLMASTEGHKLGQKSMYQASKTIKLVSEPSEFSDWDDLAPWFGGQSRIFGGHAHRKTPFLSL